MPNETIAVAPHPWLPSPDKIVFTAMLSPPSVAARGAHAAVSAYRILRTTEVDPYEPPVGRAEVASFSAAQPAGDLDSFLGTARKAAKLSLSSAPVESFTAVSALIHKLPSDTQMIALHPPISTAPNSKRVQQENRNVRVRAFLYAASREADNDFHLILGEDPTAKPSVYMTVEVSGLPPPPNNAFAKLKAARDAFKTFFGVHLPLASYDFYDPPIPVEIEGSLFFDMTHAQGGRPGPATLRPHMPTIWEVHPLSRITFEP